MSTPEMIGENNNNNNSKSQSPPPSKIQEKIVPEMIGENSKSQSLPPFEIQEETVPETIGENSKSQSLSSPKVQEETVPEMIGENNKSQSPLPSNIQENTKVSPKKIEAAEDIKVSVKVENTFVQEITDMIANKDLLEKKAASTRWYIPHSSFTVFSALTNLHHFLIVIICKHRSAYRNRTGPQQKGLKEIPEGATNCLFGKIFVITGVLDSLEREEARDLIVKYGG